MDAHARAAIDIYDRVLRYAEVEQYGSRYRLLRLGSCDFDFDVGHELVIPENGKQLLTVADALRDVFSGSVAATLNITIHPPRCFSFFSPLPTDSDAGDRKIRLQQEAALLTGTEESVHITADAVHTQALKSGGEVDWVHVLAVDEAVQSRVERLASKLPQPRRRLMVGMHAAASTIARLQRWPSGESRRGPFLLAIGWYADHVEYTLCQDQQWYFSKHTEAVPPVDVAYFAAAMMDHLRLKPSQVRRIYLYGNGIDLSLFSDLETVFELEAHRLNPLSVLDLDPGSLASDFDAEAYVGCVGAAL